MAEYVTFGFMLLLLAGNGVLFLLRAKATSNDGRPVLLRWSGWSLIVLVVFLAGIAVLTQIDANTHGIGH
ncbi:hypothetical protein D3C78_1066060 [compost metagenome]